MADTAAAKSSEKNSSEPDRSRAQQSPSPATPTGAPGQMLRLQRSIGNHAVVNLLETGHHNPGLRDAMLSRKGAHDSKRDSGGAEEVYDKRKLALQAKLTVSDPGDRYEEEADRVAEQVMRAPGPVEGRNPRPPITAVQRKTTNESSGMTAPPLVHDVLSSPGQPIDPSTRAFFEPRFGRDFSQARIHTGAQAAESARAVNASAFTVKWDVVFGAGQYAPHTDEGKRLLAHELSHVAQQTATGEGASASHSSTVLSAPAQGTVARAVSPKYSKIERKLSYKLWDWAITETEARQVLEMLQELNPEDFKDTVARMEADNIVGRLLENISDKDRVTHKALIQKIQEARSTSSMTAHIEDLLSRGILDWAITDADARLALETLKSLEGTTDRLKQVVRLIAEKQWQRLFEQLDKKDIDANKEFIADLKALRATNMTRADARDMMEKYKAATPDSRRKFFDTNFASGGLGTLMKALSPHDAANKYVDEVRELLRWAEEEGTRQASGMTDEEMAQIQAAYMESKRTKRAEEKIKAETPKGEEAPPPTVEQKAEAHKQIVGESSVKQKSEAEIEWLKKKEEEKKKWDERGKAVVTSITELANRKHPELKVKEANFRVDYEAIERRGERVRAMAEDAPDGTRRLVVGYAFVEAAEVKPEYVMSTVVHELYGHPEFGKYTTEYLLKLYDAAAAKMSDYVQPTGKERTKEIDNFAYQGTEIYAVLRGSAYHTPTSEEDRKKYGKSLSSGDPKSTVEHRIDLIKKNWAPQLAPALVRGLYVRFRLDPRLTPQALEMFRAGVRAVFKKEAKEILK